MFVEQSVINFENQNLELRYNDFALLMDEYHDGILLFDLMNEMVWSKAVKDTSALNDFYKSIITKTKSEKYFEPERVVKKVYETYSEKNHKKLLKYISRGFSDDNLNKKFNKESSLSLKIYEEMVPVSENLNMQKNSFSAGVFYVNLVVDSLKRSVKPLSAIKGLVISDYQNFLEKEWLDVLKQKYEVTINQTILTLLKQNKLNQLSLVFKENDEIPKFEGSFSQAYRQAVRSLGSSKDKYFKWRGNIYTTE
tara:strand:- start:95 stop:850 length:756 start_codon:yes stop_codon:yes gene_type:complete